MQPTPKLYFHDSSLLEFSATVVDVRPSERGESIVLDQTAFYPTGGGQPNDLGTIGEAVVNDVFEDDDGIIHHIVESPGLLAIGQTISGNIDAARRLDHMQQHSGQHILSQAFVQACGAETRSFHLGARLSTIDIDIDMPAVDLLRAAEDIANAVVFDDRPMRVHLVNEEEASRLPLRKESAVRGDIRVIEVENFDWSPCGGTHAERTGRVGNIAIRSYERFRKLTRVEFVCGRRALEEYRLANNTALAVARLFSCERDSAPELAARAIQENRDLNKQVRDLRELAISAEAAELLESVVTGAGFKLISNVFNQRDFEEVRILASKIVQREPAIALLATTDAKGARLVFARSASLTQDMGKLLSQACVALGGRGGGKPDLAQGGGPAVDKLGETINKAANELRGS